MSRTSLSPPSSPSALPFCAKCLKNQHLLRASLAQYLPDTDDPEYEQLWRDYRRFRDSQERIYPQICADCEPKVRKALDQAAYTAKTDALRRLIERGNQNRKQVIRRGWLDIFDTTGKWLWVAGLVFQLGWHLLVLQALYPQYWEIADSSCVLEFVPPADRWIRWSVLSSVLCLWWNPRFIQVFRGFTKHISGISTWYFYQLVALVMRGLLQQTTFISKPDPALANTQLAGHLFAAGFSLLVSLRPCCCNCIILTLLALYHRAPLHSNGQYPLVRALPSAPSTTSWHPSNQGSSSSRRHQEHRGTPRRDFQLSPIHDTLR